MARPLRVQFPGAIYHVTSRMVGSWRAERSRLFRDPFDYERFLDQLADRVKQYRIRLYQFNLMANHFHLVCETPEANLSDFMQSLATAYTVYFNLRHERHGHVLDGRFKSRLVEGDEYLLKLTRYVHLNPVFVGNWPKRPLRERVERLRAYAWSSYRSYVGLTKPLEFVDYGPVLAMHGGGPRERKRRYQRYVEAGLAEKDEELLEALEASPRSIGGTEFRAWVDELYQKLLGERNRREDISFRRVSEPLATAEVLGVVAEVLGVEVEALGQRRRGSALRAVAIRFLLRYAGLNQRQAAEVLGMGTGAAVSWQARRWGELEAGDRRVRRAAREAQQQLEELLDRKRRKQ